MRSKRTLQPFKHQPHKMIKRTQTIRRQEPTNYLSVFDHFVRLVFKELGNNKQPSRNLFKRKLSTTSDSKQDSMLFIKKRVNLTNSQIDILTC